MKKLLITLSVILIAGACFGQQNYTLLLTGASFASPNNGWFEFGCEAVGAEPLNRAIGGESIVDTAERMHSGTLYAKDELERMDALVIMQVHERNVYLDEIGRPMHDNWSDYEFPFDRGNYAGAYDYVIKRYLSECYNLRFDPESKYYESPFGKPAVIVLCTHWNDSRPVFNSSVRELASKWGLPVVEFDRNIGFSARSPHPVTGEQFSCIFAGDRQQIDGVTYGWHPWSGDTYIQKKMAAAFADVMRRVLPLK